jgi:hypothetical protein
VLALRVRAAEAETLINTTSSRLRPTTVQNVSFHEREIFPVLALHRLARGGM